MKNLRETMHILNGSKQYQFGYNGNGMMSVLTVTNYRTGESVMLDLSRLTEEMLDELQVEPDDENEYEY